MKSLAKKEERTTLWKHCKEKHNSEMQKSEMNIPVLTPTTPG